MEDPETLKFDSKLCEFRNEAKFYQDKVNRWIAFSFGMKLVVTNSHKAVNASFCGEGNQLALEIHIEWAGLYHRSQLCRLDKIRLTLTY